MLKSKRVLMALQIATTDIPGLSWPFLRAFCFNKISLPLPFVWVRLLTTSWLWLGTRSPEASTALAQRGPCCLSISNPWQRYLLVLWYGAPLPPTHPHNASLYTEHIEDKEYVGPTVVCGALLARKVLLHHFRPEKKHQWPPSTLDIHSSSSHLHWNFERIFKERMFKEWQITPNQLAHLHHLFLNFKIYLLKGSLVSNYIQAISFLCSILCNK